MLQEFAGSARIDIVDNQYFILDVEMNAGQMVEDVRLAVEGNVPVHFIGRMGGMILSPEDILHKLESVHESHNAVNV